MILLQGATYTALKTEGELQARSRAIALKLSWAFLILFFLSLLFTAVVLSEAFGRGLAWLARAAALVLWFLMFRALKAQQDGRAFLFSSATFLALWGVVGAIHFPNLVRATEPALSLTIYNASSSALTLKVMLIIALVGMPVVIGYTIYAYRVFRGKVTEGYY